MKTNKHPLMRLDRKKGISWRWHWHHPKADVDRLYIPSRRKGSIRNYLQNNYNWPKHISQQQRWLPPQNCEGSWPRQENNVHTPSSRKIWARTQLTRSWSGREWASHDLCPKGQAESQTPSLRTTQEQMGRKAFCVVSTQKEQKRKM